MLMLVHEETAIHRIWFTRTEAKCIIHISRSIRCFVNYGGSQFTYDNREGLTRSIVLG